MQEKIEKAMKDLNCKMDAHLIESIASLFHQGVLKHYVRSPRTNVDMDNFKMSIDAASGVKFEGRERLIELKAENEKLKRILKLVLDQNSMELDLFIHNKIYEAIKG